jgi:MFS family permease
MIQQLHVPARLTSDIFLVGSIILFFGFVGSGLLSQMIGRRRMIVLCGVAVLVGGTGLYALLVTRALAGATMAETAVIAMAFYILIVSPWGIVTTYISERFPTHIRASGYGIGYSAAVVIPAFAGAYLLGLSALMPYVFGPLVLLVIAGLLMIAGALMGPETRDVDMHPTILPETGTERIVPRAAGA